MFSHQSLAVAAIEKHLILKKQDRVIRQQDPFRSIHPSNIRDAAASSPSSPHNAGRELPVDADNMVDRVAESKDWVARQCLII